MKITLPPRAIIPIVIIGGLVLGGIAYGMGATTADHTILLLTLVAGFIPLLYETFQEIRNGHFGVDIIAIVAITTSIIVGQYIAGAVILLMMSGGEALEDYAMRRARKELTSLLARAPEIAHKKIGDELKDVPVGSVKIDDIIIVKPGEIIPVDGEVLEGACMVDESALTGESIPVEKTRGVQVMSGSIAKDGVLTVRTLRPSSESKYAQIIRLIEEAEEKKAPFVRLADRYSVWFTAVTFVLALLAWWLSEDPVRLLAVLVVATPCPLILATPIAFAGGISRSASRGIIIRNGGALEKLGEARSFLFDKTGTLTIGVPEVVDVRSYSSSDDILRIAGSLEQLSAHVLARALVRHARALNIPLVQPSAFQEKFGEGVEGVIDGQVYRMGRMSYLQSSGISISNDREQEHAKAQESGQIIVYLAREQTLIGAVIFADRPRSNVHTLIPRLRRLGIQTIRMLTGDRLVVARRIAKDVGIDESDIRAECLPEEKVREVEKLRKEYPPVVMVGDGINDAPALAIADVGIAMGAHGGTASSEAGDVVILVDNIERVGEALSIGHAVLRIAKESIFIGIGLSIVLMLIAALGFISPIFGALSQEVIDVLVILNALRVLFTKTGWEDATHQVS